MLPSATISYSELTDLLKPENKEKLAYRLKYHVIGGKQVLTNNLTAFQNFEMLAGGMSNVTRVVTNQVSNSKINEVTISMKDVTTSNGIIHVIDAVLTPPAKKNAALSRYTNPGLFVVLLSIVVSLIH